MPALPVIADVFRCTLEWSTEGGIAPRNVLHLRSNTHDESDIGLVLAGAMDDNADAFVFLGGAFDLENVAVLPLDGATATVRPPLEASPSGGAGGQVVPEACMVITLATALRGPAHRGRVFVGPGTEDNINNGVISTSASAVTAAWAGLMADLLLEDVELVVASYVHGTAATVESATAHSYVATQRRRLLQTRA